jgi:hypothetical protein
LEADPPKVCLSMVMQNLVEMSPPKFCQAWICGSWRNWKEVLEFRPKVSGLGFLKPYVHFVSGRMILCPAFSAIGFVHLWITTIRSSPAKYTFKHIDRCRSIQRFIKMCIAFLVSFEYVHSIRNQVIVASCRNHYWWSPCCLVCSFFFLRFFRGEN